MKVVPEFHYMNRESLIYHLLQKAFFAIFLGFSKEIIFVLMDLTSFLQFTSRIFFIFK